MKSPFKLVNDEKKEFAPIKACGVGSTDKCSWGNDDSGCWFYSDDDCDPQACDEHGCSFGSTDRS